MAQNPLVPPREGTRYMEVLQLRADGLSYEEIADKMSIEIATVKSSLTTSVNKLDANNPTHAVAEGFRRGLLK